MPRDSTLRNAVDRVHSQNDGGRRKAFSYGPDNIHWPYAACTAGIRHEQISGVCACGSWLLMLKPGSYATSFFFGLLWSDTMHDCLRRFSRKVIAGFAQAFVNVVGKPAIFARHFAWHLKPPVESYDGRLTLPT
jgi:hypothetical protein